MPNQKKFKAKKVATPGSAVPAKAHHKLSPRRPGRPKKPKNRHSRKDNYRCKYSGDAFENAVNAVKEKKMSIREAAKHYKVPKSTICDRLQGKKPKVGRPQELTEEEEKLLVQRLMVMADWGFPITSMDMCYVIRDYLNSQDRKTRFINNLPGRGFVRKFLKRHRELSVRRASLIKRARAEMSPEIVKEFFVNYTATAQDIPPANVYNYDETNLRDDPGAVKALFPRGYKYAEQVGDHSKSAYSIMFCGTAAGELLPPYVVYKGANTYPSWCQGGPPGTIYTATASGWFDAWCFRDFIEKIVLPNAKKKVLFESF